MLNCRSEKRKMETPAFIRRSSSSRSLTLSELPETLIQEILSRLPIKDAGRTSILSHSWRCRWRSVPDFDLCGFSPSQIYQLLNLHSGFIRLFKAHEPKPLEFGLRTPGEWSYADICRWIPTLSLHSGSTLRSLSLSSNSWLCSFDFSKIARFFPNLTLLHLSGTVRDCGGYKLSALKDLQLHLSETGYGVPSSIVSSCPLLETLDLNSEYRDTSTPETLDIVAPNLRRLKLSQIELPDFTVSSAPLLETVSFNCCYFDEEAGEGEEGNAKDGGGLEDCTLTKVLRGMVSIKKLELDHQFLMFLGSGIVDDTIPISFRNLVVVSLSVDFGYLDAVLGILCLLWSIPDLRELNIRAYECLEDRSEVVEAVDDFWEEHDFADYFNNLETVKLTGISYKQDEMGFIRSLLAYAHVLKTVMISFDQCVNNKESIMTELLELPKASDQAQILLTR